MIKLSEQYRRVAKFAFKLRKTGVYDAGYWYVDSAITVLLDIPEYEEQQDVDLKILQRVRKIVRMKS